MMLLASFRSQIDRGSDAHRLLDEVLTAVTSSMLMVLKLSSSGTLPRVYCGDGADDVATLT